MRNIDIGGICSSFERSMLFFLDKIYDTGYIHDNQSISDFIEIYLAECPGSLKKELSANPEILRDIRFSDESIESYNKYRRNKEIKEFMADAMEAGCGLSGEKLRELQELCVPDELELMDANSSVYNICGILIYLEMLEKKLDDYMDAIETKCYEEALYKLVEVIENIVTIENAVTNYVLDMHMDNIMDLSEHYRLLPEILYYLEPDKRILSIYDHLTEWQPSDMEQSDGMYYSQVISLCYDVACVRRKLDVLKFVLAFICIIRSPEYKGTWKQLSKLFVDLFRDIFYQVTIHKVLLQTKKLEGAVEARGSLEGTTRMRIIFSLRNNDIYVLRIDMPHKGKFIMHLNMEELYRDSIIATGFPLKLHGEEHEILKKYPQNVVDKLFWKINERLWFRSNYQRIIKETDIGENEKDFLQKLFEKQSHKEIELPFEYDEKDILSFFAEIKEYLVRFRITNLVCTEFGKDEEKLIRTIDDIKTGRSIYNNLVKEAKEIYDSPCDYNKILWKIYGERGLGSDGLTEESLKTCGMKEIWRLIGQYCDV